jgi:SAM-dependent methyltransferase
MGKREKKKTQKEIIKDYIDNGRIPWTSGYLDYRNKEIISVINNKETIDKFKNGIIPNNLGINLDERIVEYLWVFSFLRKGNFKVLDAGSTLNHSFILDHKLISGKDLSILTLAPESQNFNEKGISYIYSDLRDIPFKDNYFDIIISQSTIEHIDMDNSMYGYTSENNSDSKTKSYQYIIAIRELERTLKNKGKLLLTFPYGIFENHGFFQQFDQEMVKRISAFLSKKGNIKMNYFRYLKDGWRFCNKKDCDRSKSFNPHTGTGKGDDGAAHSRSICCIEFNKN